ncbi:carboxyl transferase domain-containing protein, partial [Thermodesulfobacteriota bacterium]
MNDKTNDTARSVLERVEQQRHGVLDEGRQEAVERQHKRGKLTARERIEYLLDPGTFHEYGSLIEPLRGSEESRDLQAPADGVATGTGRIDGRPLALASYDFTILGGSGGQSSTQRRHPLHR